MNYACFYVHVHTYIDTCILKFITYAVRAGILTFMTHSRLVPYMTYAHAHTNTQREQMFRELNSFRSGISSYRHTHTHTRTEPKSHIYVN